MSLQDVPADGPKATGSLLLGVAVWITGVILLFLATALFVPLPIADPATLVLLFLGVHLPVFLQGAEPLAVGAGPILLLVPIAVTLAGGAAAGRGHPDGAVVGAGIAPGYFGASMVAFGLATLSVGTTPSYDAVLYAVVAGVGQPALFGAIGGALSAGP